MFKNKYFVWSGWAVAAVSLAALVFLAWNGRKHEDKVDIGRGSLQAAAIDSTASNQQTAGSLSVSAGGATNLGQLGTSSGAGGGSGQSSGGASSSGSGSSASAINPATFGQYEKYKDSAGALFGEAQIGSGAELTANKKAAVYYKGWLTNGQMFDESKVGSDGKLQPFVFTLGAHQVIPGWEQGVAGMKVGGVRLIIVPPSVGYGSTGQGSIPPNSVLVFQVQLLEVQ